MEEDRKEDVELQEHGAKVTMGYDYGLSENTYRKDKMSTYVSCFIGGSEYDQDKAYDLAWDRAEWMLEKLAIKLKKAGEEMIEAIVQDKWGAERAEYEKTLATARTEYKKLQEENLKLKEQKNGTKPKK